MLTKAGPAKYGPAFVLRCRRNKTYKKINHRPGCPWLVLDLYKSWFEIEPPGSFLFALFNEE